MSLKSRLRFSLAPFTRYVAEASLVEPEQAAPTLKASTPKCPLFWVQVDESTGDTLNSFGMWTVAGCDMLILDVYTPDKCYSTVMSAGDPCVHAALRSWHAAEELPIWRQRMSGRYDCASVKGFTIRPEHELVLARAMRPEYLEELQEAFNTLLDPGVVEANVAKRLGQEFKEVQVGFLATKYSRPALPRM